jgi:regulator of sigma E protease
MRRDDLKQPATANPSAETADENLTVRQWLGRNAVMLVLLAILGVVLFINFDGDGLWAIAKAALGLSFVIFIHELGHFLVAKWCDVHVQTFSIGFGPALPGCSFKWGETTYKLALFPLGGYVQMVGQVDGHEESDGTEDDPRSYKNKTVGQRMAIISAGVTMNVILAVICFVIVFQGPGKDRKAAIVSAVDSRSPAFVKGIPTGAVITQIGDVENPYFEDLMGVVMATQSGQLLPVTYQIEGKSPVTIEIEPRVDNGRPMLGIAPAQRLQFEEKRYLGKTFEHPVLVRSAASQAKPAFDFKDRIVATTDPEQKSDYDAHKVKELRPDPRNPSSGLCDYFEFRERMRRLAGKEVTIRVLRGPGYHQPPIDILVPPAFHYTFGARMQMGQITAVRQGSAAQRADVQAKDANRSLNGDIIEKVELPEPDGKVTIYDKEKDLDPLRLPFQLREWAERWSRAGQTVGDKLDSANMLVKLHVLRHSTDKRQQDEAKVLQLRWDRGWDFDNELPFNPDSPLPIPQLGLAYQVRTTVATVEPAREGVEASALQPGDVIKEVRLAAYRNTDSGKEVKKDEPWIELQPDQWAFVFSAFQHPSTVKQVTVKVERNKEVKEFAIKAQEDRGWPLVERGLGLSTDQRCQKADNFIDAVSMGLRDTSTIVVQVFQNLRGMFTSRISVTNLGGPLRIAEIAYTIAGVDFWEFLFFLGMISVNLAVINFLPIPVLDGGHMMFLLYEKIRGKPAPEQVRVGATYAGLLLLASVMIFVLYLDIRRLLH